MAAPLVLGSSSPYRRDLLRRLAIPFTQEAPAIDEARRAGEAPDQLAARLAREKAAAVAAKRPDAWVLASDQLAAIDDDILGKPGDAPRAEAQLARCSGRSVRFLTSVCLRRAGHLRQALDVTTVRFRTLGHDEIQRYVAREEPFDCAGSFRAEGLGIALFAALTTEDPTAIVGLPLITVAALLREAGFEVP